MAHYEDLYIDLYPQFAPKFQRKNLNFDRHFKRLYNDTYNDGTNTFRENMVKSLQAILAEYSASEPHTKGGGVLRKIGKVLGYILPFIKMSRK